MKFIITLLLLAVPAFAELIPVLPQANVGFGLGSTNNSSLRSWAIVTARSSNGGAPAIQYINAGSGSNNVQMQFYKVAGAIATVTHSNTTTSVPVSSTNGFAVNDVIIIRSMASDDYQRLAITTFTGATNLTLSATSFGGTGTIVPGDMVYRVVQAGTIRWGASTNSLGPAQNIFVGQKGMPLLVEIAGDTASASIFVLGGQFIP